VSVRETDLSGSDIVYVAGEHESSLVRVASSIAELAPLHLFIRYYVRKADFLVIEEPEAHLHPSAIKEVARVLALLANKGVRVLIITHSDYLLSKLSSLIQTYSVPGELPSTGGV